MLSRRRVPEHAWTGLCCSVEMWGPLASHRTRPVRVCSSAAGDAASDDEIKEMGPYEKVDWVQTTIIHGKRGHDILSDPIFNQGTAFNHSERERLGIRGLLPPKVSNLTEQKRNIMRDYYQGLDYVGPEDLENWSISR